MSSVYRSISAVLDEMQVSFDNNLMLGDFIFGICVGGGGVEADPAHIVMKSNRDTYIRYITMRADINKTFGYDQETYIKAHKKLLIGCRIEGIITRSIIRTRGEQWSTVVYNMAVNQKLTQKSEHKFFGNLFIESPYTIINNKYLVATFRDVVELRHKRKEMESVSVPLWGVKTANTFSYILDQRVYDLNKDAILLKKNETLEKCGCTSDGEYFDKLKKILKNPKYCRFSDNNEHYYKHCWQAPEEEEILKSFQKMTMFSILSTNIFNKKFYLPCFMDNRGRQYYGGTLSPTFYEVFRYFYKFHNKKNLFVDLEVSMFYKKLMKYKQLVQGYKLDDRHTYILLVLLMEVGKYFCGKGKCFTSVEEFIKSGIANLNNNGLAFEENIYVSKIRDNIITLTTGGGCDYDTILFKDATASGLQNYGILLGYKEDALAYLNMDGDRWCDTYQYIIDTFVQDPTLKNRKYWKKTIMTVVYNATWHTCFVDFLNMLREEGTDYRTLSEDRKKAIKNTHKNFYDSVKHPDFLKLFYKNQTGTMQTFSYNKWEIEHEKEYKINHRGHRDKYIERDYKVVRDESKTKIAQQANNLHYIDATLVREMLRSVNLITIHDCFGVRLCDLHILMDNINAYYSNHTKKNTYALFIIK